MKNNKLIIFDFDGVLVDTEYTTFCYYKKILPKFEIHLKESDFKYKIGRKSIDFFKDVLKDKFDPDFVKKITMQKRKAFQNDIKKYLKPLPGVFNLLDNLSKTDLTLTIGSQNERELIEKAVDVFNIRKYFKVITSLQDIKNKKPDPELFLLVAKKAKISPKYSVVIEDAPVGIKAAKKGGFTAIGITSSFKRKNLKRADLIINSMTELNYNLLKNI